jgi:hypothetical protein
MNKYRGVIYVLILVLLIDVLLVVNVKACKVIVAYDTATEGDYNLLLKVRDPSRPGLQVLCMVPEGYEYTYHHPWNGKPMSFIVKHKFIGVASKDDTIPNIVKAGMALSDMGIAYCDADSNSNYLVNPSKHAWDDFDWIRYACQTADDEEQANKLLTKDVVDDLHASGVSENLFVVGPRKAYFLEADFKNYKIKDIQDYEVISNYPKDLWRSQFLRRIRIASSYDKVVEKQVFRGRTIRLGALYGIRLVDIGPDWIIVKPVPSYDIRKIGNRIKRLDTGNNVLIRLGESKDVGFFYDFGGFRVKLLECNRFRAKISMSTTFKAWEDKMVKYIEARLGSITVRDMINWSRLHRQDLDGLRPMCQGSYKYEGVAIYRIPEQNYMMLSSGWFSANHACSSIYVPFHICNTDIFDAYENGEAAELSLNLFNIYGHGALETSFQNVEEVFLNEIEKAEKISIEKIVDNQKISEYLTIVDNGMQRQAMITQQIWMEISKISKQEGNQAVRIIVNKIWDEDYLNSINHMRKSISYLKELPNTDMIIDKIKEIAIDICKTRIDAANSIGKQDIMAINEYKNGGKLLRKGEYESGFNSLQKSFILTDLSFMDQEIKNIKTVETEKNNEIDYFLLYLIIAVIIAVSILFKRFKVNFE